MRQAEFRQPKFQADFLHKGNISFGVRRKSGLTGKHERGLIFS
jgi:hypothetical protein